MSADVLAQLVRLSNRLGDPANDYAILGEGNTSAQTEDGSFWIKASGCNLGAAGPDHFVRVDAARALALLDLDAPSDDEVRIGLVDATLEATGDRLPSVETMLHALCLRLEGVVFVGHTHPTAVNAITCSQAFEEALAGRIFPDEIVLCGPASVLVPYVDPGVPLAREVGRRLDDFVGEHGERPRVIYMQNHGFIALGASAREVEDIHAMAVKAARILAGTFALGGPRFLSREHAQRIHVRPDEHYRQRVIEER